LVAGKNYLVLLASLAIGFIYR
jgi:ABC-type bacteriocin/lantibiotic exporter with double-glycine peptidase domain